MLLPLGWESAGRDLLIFLDWLVIPLYTVLSYVIAQGDWALQECWQLYSVPVEGENGLDKETNMPNQPFKNQVAFY